MIREKDPEEAVGTRGALPRLRGRGEQGDWLRKALPFPILSIVLIWYEIFVSNNPGHLDC
jgi:hypothetical protein